MRNFKKILAVVLAVLFVVPTTFVAVHADNNIAAGSYWTAFGTNAVTAVDNGDGSVTVSETNPTTGGRLTVYNNNYKTAVNGTLVTVTPQSVTIDDAAEYPNTYSVMFTDHPELHNTSDAYFYYHGYEWTIFGGDTVTGVHDAKENHLEISLCDVAAANASNQYDMVKDQSATTVYFEATVNGNYWGDGVTTLPNAVDLTKPICFDFLNDERGFNVTIYNTDDYQAANQVNLSQFAGGFDGSESDNEDAIFTTFVSSSSSTAVYGDNNTYSAAAFTVSTDCYDENDQAVGHMHMFGAYTKTADATCVDLEQRTATCAICNATTTMGVYGTLTEHPWDEGVVTRQADCKNTEKTTYTCTYCGATKEETTGEKLPHVYYDIEDERNTPATCTETGIQIQQCDQRTPSHTKVVTLPALGHNVETWTVVQEGTCTTAAVEQGECTRCHEIISREGEIGGHNYVITGTHEGKFVEVCSVCGDRIQVTPDANGDLVDAEGNDAEHDNGAMSANDYWTVDATNKAGTALGAPGYDDMYFTGIENGALRVYDVQYAFRDYPATYNAVHKAVSKFTDSINGFTATITPIPTWGTSGGFPYAQNYGFLWTNTPDLYREASFANTDAFNFAGTTHPADEISIQLVLSDGTYGSAANACFITYVVNGTVSDPIGTVLDTAIPFSAPITVSVDNGVFTLSNGQAIDLASTLAGAGVDLSGEFYFGVQSTTNWTNLGAIRALDGHFELTSINGDTNTATWTGSVAELAHEWGASTVVTAGTCQAKAVLSHTCDLCGQSEEIEGEYGDHNYVATLHAGLVVNTCSVCGDRYTTAIDGGTLTNDGDNYIQADANGNNVMVENAAWTAHGFNYDGTDLGIGAGYNNWYVTGITANGNVFIKDEAQFFNDQPAASRAQSVIVSKGATASDGFTTVITPYECEGNNNGFTKYAQNYSVLFTNHPELYRTAREGQGFEGFIRANDGMTHPADEMSFEIVLWNNNLDNTVTYVFAPSVINGVVDAAINTMTALAAPVSLTAPIEIGVSTAGGNLVVNIAGTDYTFNKNVDGTYYLGYQASNSINASQYRIMSARFEITEINGEENTAYWIGNQDVGHDWSAWTRDGDTMSRTCSICNEVETKPFEITIQDATVTELDPATIDITGVTVDKAVSFTAVDTLADAEFYGTEDFIVDFELSFNQAVDGSKVSLYGNYGSYGWQGGTLADGGINSLAADQTFAIMADWFTGATGGEYNGTMKYSEIIDLGTFSAAIAAPEYDDLTATLTLVVTDPATGTRYVAGTYEPTIEHAPAKDYVMTFDANGGTVLGEASVSYGVNYLETYASATGWSEIVEPVREGYIFEGWVYGGFYTLSSLNDQYGLQSDGTFVAQWNKIGDYTLTFDANGGTIDGAASVNFDIDYMETYASATGWSEIHEPVREGYKFGGWIYANVYQLTDLNDQYGLQADGTFVAKWLQITDRYLDMTGHAFTNTTQTVGNNFNASGIASNGGINFVVEYEDGSTEVVKNRGNKKYFNYYLEDDTVLGLGNDVVALTAAMVGEHTVRVVSNEAGYEAFEGTTTLTIAKPYTLTFDANGGTIDGQASVSFGICNGESYASATGWAEMHEPVREGYTFDGWVYGGFYTLNNLNETYGLTEDGAFVAAWTEIPVEEVPPLTIRVTDDSDAIRDIFVIDGHYDSYKGIKTARLNGDFTYYDRMSGARFMGLEAAKYPTEVAGTHDFRVPEPGEYTVLIRYTDGTEDYIYYDVATDIAVEKQASVTYENGVLTADVTATGLTVKAFRYAPTANVSGLSTSAIKHAVGARSLPGTYFVEGVYTYSKKPLSGDITWVIEYTDGTAEYGEFHA